MNTPTDAMKEFEEEVRSAFKMRGKEIMGAHEPLGIYADATNDEKINIITQAAARLVVREMEGLAKQCNLCDGKGKYHEMYADEDDGYLPHPTGKVFKCEEPIHATLALYKALGGGE